MGRSGKVLCALCQRDEETKITGALSTKDDVTAHQNCLLFSSGICCRDTPEFDDLFGFSTEDVLDEVKRGSKLHCHYCKKKGATAGCEVKRCKRSYHYPCAVKDGAKTIEDADNGHYGLYCLKHYIQQKNKNNTVNGLSKAGPSKDITEPGPSKKTNGDSGTASPSVHHSDSSSSSGIAHSSSKRPLSEGERQEERPFKRKTEGWNLIITDDSSNSDENETNIGNEMFAPLESDLDESANSVPENQLFRKDTENATGSASGDQQEDEREDENKEEDEMIMYSDAESESLLRPVMSLPGFPSPIKSPAKPEGCSLVHTPGQHTNRSSIPQQSSRARPPFSDQVPLSNSKPSINATSFWKSCNAAGCTRAIFTDFINGMNEISSKILSDQATQEDYGYALSVMAVSGKLAELVTKQQEEIQRKQMELQKAAAAMKDVVSALRK